METARPSKKIRKLSPWAETSGIPCKSDQKQKMKVDIAVYTAIAEDEESGILLSRHSDGFFTYGLKSPANVPLGSLFRKLPTAAS